MKLCSLFHAAVLEATGLLEVPKFQQSDGIRGTSMMNHSTHGNDKNMNDSQGLRFTSTGNTHSRTGAYSSAILSYLWISTWIKPLPFFNFWTCWCLIKFLLAFPSPTHQPTRRTIRESPHPGRNQSQSRRPDIEGCSPENHPKDFQCWK